MLSYHSVTVFEHPYSSEWYEWLWDKRPLLDSYSILSRDKISTVATFINPLLCWGGFVALFHQIYLWKTRRSNNSVFLVLAYVSVMLPWLFIHRTVFIYQYFLGMIFLDCELLQPLFKRKKIYGDYRRDVYHIICFILSGTIGNGCKYRLC